MINTTLKKSLWFAHQEIDLHIYLDLNLRPNCLEFFKDALLLHITKKVAGILQNLQIKIQRLLSPPSEKEVPHFCIKKILVLMFLQQKLFLLSHFLSVGSQFYFCCILNISFTYNNTAVL